MYYFITMNYNSYVENFACYNMRDLDTIDDKDVRLLFECYFDNPGLDILNLINECYILPLDVSKIVHSYTNNRIVIDAKSNYKSLKQTKLVYDVQTELCFDINGLKYYIVIHYNPCIYIFSLTHELHRFMTSIRSDFYSIFIGLIENYNYNSDHTVLLNQFNNWFASISMHNKITNINIFLKIMCCTLMVMNYVRHIKPERTKKQSNKSCIIL